MSLSSGLKKTLNTEIGGSLSQDLLPFLAMKLTAGTY